MIHLYTGEGKGKTTAAVGLVVRAAGRGVPVTFAQFMKGNDTGELYVLNKLPEVTICRSEKNFGFYRSMTEEQKAELTTIHNRILDTLLIRARKGAGRMIVLDEITYPVNWGLVDVDKLGELLALGKKELEIVLTGRDAAPLLQDAADYITEMQAVRHPYERGVMARVGIEF